MENLKTFSVLCVLVAAPAFGVGPQTTAKSTVIDGVEWRYREVDANYYHAGDPYGYSKGDVLVGDAGGPAIDQGFSGHLDVPDFGGRVVLINARAFEGCTNVTSVSIPEGVIEIARDAFSGCTSLTNVVFPESLTSIFFDAFSDCTALQEVTFPAGTDRVYSSAFTGCTALESVTFLGTPTYQSANCSFDGCPALRSVTLTGFSNVLRFSLPETVEEYHVTAGSTELSEDDCVLFDAAGTTLLRFPRGRGGSYTVPAGTCRVADEAFRDCGALSAVDLPASVTNLAGGAFLSCTSLVSATGCAGLLSIGANAFRSCGALASFPFGDALRDVGARAFHESGVAAADFGTGLRSIGDEAFMNCPDLVSVSIKTGATAIGSSAFANCGNLVSASVPGTVSTIPYRAFYCCTNLETLVIGNGVKTIADSAFCKDSRISALDLPDSVETVGQHAFDSCTGLRSVSLGNGLRSIGVNAFLYCPGLLPTSLPDSLRVVQGGAFSGCPLPEWFVIPANVTAMAGTALRRSTGLKVLYMPEALEIADSDVWLPERAVVARYSGSPKKFLTEFEPFGPGGAVGRGNAFDPGSVATVSVPAEFATNGWKVACAGWTRGTGGIPATGASNAVSFAIDEHSTLEWKWGDTNVWISCPTTGSATADFEEGWVPFGSVKTLTWTPTEDGTVPKISGDTNGVVVDAAARTLRIPADGPRSLALRVAVPTHYTERTPVPVPHEWLERFPDRLAASGGDFEDFALSTAANGWPVWKCYVAGLSPTNAAERFTATISMSGGSPRIVWSPDLSDDPENPRVYSVTGKADLGDGNWAATNAATHFFRVEVSLP